MVVVVVVVVVVAMVVVMTDGRGVCGWCSACFLRSGIYYFIVLKAKINPLLQHMYR